MTSVPDDNDFWATVEARFRVAGDSIDRKEQKHRLPDAYNKDVERFKGALKGSDTDLEIPQFAWKAYLDKNPHVVTAPYGVELLGLALKGALQIDLQPFVSISGSKFSSFFALLVNQKRMNLFNS